jgi:hypothetical protein
LFRGETNGKREGKRRGTSGRLIWLKYFIDIYEIKIMKPVKIVLKGGEGG